MKSYNMKGTYDEYKHDKTTINHVDMHNTRLIPDQISK